MSGNMGLEGSTPIAEKHRDNRMETEVDTGPFLDMHTGLSGTNTSNI